MIEARPTFSPCQILALEFKKYVLLTPWLLCLGVPNSETAIPDF